MTDLHDASTHDVPVHVTTHTLHGPNGLSRFAAECASALFADIQYVFRFPTGTTLQEWDPAKIKEVNKEFLGSLRHRGNLYCIFVRDADPRADWKPVYVGERKSEGLRERITQHLVSKHDATGSKLDAIKTAVASGQKIGLSFVNIQPESLRLYVEETIINEWKRKDQLPWNTHC